MSKVVWKYAMAPAYMWRIVEIDEAGFAVKSSTSRNILQAWFVVNPDATPVKRHFLTVPTGGSVPADYTYIDTIFDGPLVWHIFEDPAAMGQEKIEGRDYG